MARSATRGLTVALAGLVIAAVPSEPVAAVDLPYPLEMFATAFLSDEDIRATAEWGALVPDTPQGQECAQQPGGGYACVRAYPVSPYGFKPYVLSARTYPGPLEAKAAFDQAVAAYRAKASRELAATPTDFSVQWTLDPIHFVVTSGRLDRNHYVEASCFARSVDGFHRAEDVNTCTQLLLNAQMPRLADFESPVVSIPAPPVGVLSSVKGAVATVTWLPPESDGGSSITEYVATSTDGSLTCTSTPSPGLLQACSVGGVRAGVTYAFTVTSVNIKGSSIPSQPSLPSRYTSVSSAPRVVFVRTTGTTAVVRWKRPTTLGGLPVVRYIVTARPGGRSCTTSTTSCAVEDLDFSSRYRFSVRAVNARGASRTAISAWARTGAAPALPAPPQAAPAPAPDVPSEKPTQDPS